MKARFSLIFPYLCAFLVIGVIVWRGGQNTSSPLAVHTDPVCRMEVGEGIKAEWHGSSYYFCTDICRQRFAENPRTYLQETCLVCQSENSATPPGEEPRFEATWQGKTYSFCTPAHRDAFRADPAGFFMHTMWGIPNWLYYTSIGLILLLSFAIIEWRADHRDTSPGNSSFHPYPRFDLLQFTYLRRLLVHPLTRFLLQALVVAFFALIIAAGLFGNQLPSKNIAPLLTWTVWWGGLILLILYAGKAWCYICPWDAIAGWAEGLRFWGRKKEGLSLNLKWPGFLRNIWPATLLFIGLIWIELGLGVTTKPRATAWLGLGMLGLAFASAFIFERRSFCRYGCLVGRVSGLYALFSPIEVRARDLDVCRSCATRGCYRGDERGEPCPTFQYLGTMEQNTYCISCMECLKSCDKDNVALQLRPWGQDLATHHHPRTDEAYLALLMLALTGFHGLTMTAAWRTFIQRLQSIFDLGETTSFTLGMAGSMLAPIFLYALLASLSHALVRQSGVPYRKYFIHYAYALLPIALFYHLAHNSEHLLMEGQKVVALLSDPFGFEWDLWGTAGWSLAPLVDLPTLWIIQVFLIMIGHVYSLWVARRTAGALFSSSRLARRSQIPMLAAMILFSTMSLWLLKQPMEMRTSAM